MELIDIRIDPEVESKIPPLTNDELTQLEENILADGSVRDPLVLWQGILVDGHNSMGKRVKAVKPELERYAGLVQQIKEKSKERKNLLAEKKETPFYQITKLHDLTRRIAELTEEIEELKIEKEMLLRSLNCADGAGISAAKKEITTLEGALQHQHHHLRPLSLDRRQVRHHRLPGGAGHPPPDRGHLDPGGHGHSLQLLRQHRQS